MKRSDVSSEQKPVKASIMLIGSSYVLVKESCWNAEGGQRKGENKRKDRFVDLLLMHMLWSNSVLSCCGESQTLNRWSFYEKRVGWRRRAA